MTMSWSDEVSESTRSHTHTVRYVPPHFRAAPSRISGRSEFPIRVGDLSRRFGAIEVSPATEIGNGGINFEAYEDIPVEVSGAEVPAPASSFAEMETLLGDRLSENVRRCGYVKPTPVQRHAIPIAAVGRDLMACAQTGSGKTAAFCFPIISGITKSDARSRTRSLLDCCYPVALVLSPTRELASQIHDEAKKFAQNTGVKIVAAYGGSPVFPQIRNLERGVDILVATPGRLIDLFDKGRISLSSVKYLTLDEADRMLDMGFEVQIRRIVQNTDMPPPGVRQTMLFSATFPAEIQKMASDFLSNYIFLAVGRVGSSTDLIAQRVEYVEESEKRTYLMRMLHDQIVNGCCGKLALTLVFVETKKGADALEYCLWENGFPAISIHGDKVQMERERALRSFKSGETPILVATAVASRGLDIPHVAHVVNFDLPRDIDDYVHRIGRTGRAGKSGLATAFFNDKNAPIAKPLADLMKESNQEVPPWLQHYFAGDRSASSSSPGAGAQNHNHNHRRGGAGAGKFGGYDYRNLSSGGENFNYPSFDPNIAPAVATGGEFSSSSSLSANAEPYLCTSDKYASVEGYKSVVATGWD